MRPETYYEALGQCIDLLRQGASIDDCLRRYPQFADQLRPQLDAAAAVAAAPAGAQVDPAAMARSRARLLGGVADARRQPAAAAAPTFAIAAPLGALFSGFRKLAFVPYALPAVLAMLLLGGAAFGVAAATGNSGPFGSSSSSRIEVRGVLAAIDADSLTVTTGAGDVILLLDANTEFEDENEQHVAPDAFAIRSEVKVRAFRNAAGELVAQEVELEDDDDDQPDGAVETPALAPTAENDDDHEDNSGPGNAEDRDDEAAEPTEIEDEDEDNSGPGNGNDRATEVEDDDDHSGPGDGDEPDDDNSGPGGGETDDDDHSGPGGGGDD